MKHPYSIRPVIFLCLVILSCLLASGCMFNTGASKPEDTPPPAAADKQDAELKKPTAVYHDFEDVLVPLELSIVKNRTMIISTPGYRSGILTLKGRVDSTSLYNFFSNNMEKDNWEVISRIKSPETTIMVYHKRSRCAVITIRDEQFYTYVEIGVAPTLESSSLGKSKTLTY